MQYCLLGAKYFPLRFDHVLLLLLLLIFIDPGDGSPFHEFVIGLIDTVPQI